MNNRLSTFRALIIGAALCCLIGETAFAEQVKAVRLTVGPAAYCGNSINATVSVDTRLPNNFQGPKNFAIQLYEHDSWYLPDDLVGAGTGVLTGLVNANRIETSSATIALNCFACVNGNCEFGNTGMLDDEYGSHEVYAYVDGVESKVWNVACLKSATGAFRVASALTEPGESSTVTVGLQQEVAVASVSYALQYDPTYLSVTSVAFDPAVTAAFELTDADFSVPGEVQFDALTETPGGVMLDGAFEMQITFAVDPEAPYGEYQISTTTTTSVLNGEFENIMVNLGGENFVVGAHDLEPPSIDTTLIDYDRGQGTLTGLAGATTDQLFSPQDWVKVDAALLSNLGGRDIDASTLADADGGFAVGALAHDNAQALAIVATDSSGNATAAVQPFAVATNPWRISEGMPGRQGNADAWRPSLSDDGRYLAFDSRADNYVRGDTNGQSDVFVTDQVTGWTIRASVASDGTEGNLDSTSASLSGDGLRVAFVSHANNLVAADTNGTNDVFLRDLGTGETIRIVNGYAGGEADGRSLDPVISDNGMFVAFASDASNLVPADSNGQRDVFVYSIGSGQIERVSVDSAGAQATWDSSEPAISADGRFVAFASNADNLVSGDGNFAPDIFVHDRESGETSRVSVDSQGNEGYGYFQAAPAISANGRWVAFESDAPELAGQPFFELAQIFMHDRATGATTWLTAGGDGDHLNPEMSADGSLIVFSSDSPNLAAGDADNYRDGFMHDRRSGENSLLSKSTTGLAGNADSGGFSNGLAISANGRIIAFESEASNLAGNDQNARQDIIVRDHTTANTMIASMSHLGEDANGGATGVSLAPAGRHVAYASSANNLVAGDLNDRSDVFVYDSFGNRLERVSVATDGAEADGDSQSPSVSSDGRFVAFESYAENLIGTDDNLVSDVFVRDRATGTTARISAAQDGSQGDNMSFNPSISENGRWVAFVSYASNLVAGDTNLQRDAFLKDTQTGLVERISVADQSGAEGNGESGEFLFTGDARVVSNDGRFVVFESFASNLSGNDFNEYKDVYLRDRQLGRTWLVSETIEGIAANGDSDAPTMSNDGRYVAFVSSADDLVPGDDNQAADVFVRDMQTGALERVSVASSGSQGNADSGGHGALAISNDGRFVVFTSAAGNLVNGDQNAAPDVFVRDRDSGETSRLTDVAGDEPDAAILGVTLDRNGTVGFASAASNLVNDDSNGLTDVYLIGFGDDDTDGVVNFLDNCASASNPDQFDADGDGLGNACDRDLSNDCIVNAVDLGILKSRFFGNDPSADFNNDGTVNVQDLGALKADFFEQPGPSGLSNICAD